LQRVVVVFRAGTQSCSEARACCLLLLGLLAAGVGVIIMLFGMPVRRQVPVQLLLQTGARRGVSVKRKNSYPVIHASQRPGEDASINFGELGLKYPMTHPCEFVVKKTSWTRPPSSLPDLPFAVDRTSVGLALPVYTDYRAGGTKVITILRKCRGDIDELRVEMEKVTGKPVLVRPGKLVVDGNYHARLKKWLTGIGF